MILEWIILLFFSHTYTSIKYFKIKFPLILSNLEIEICNQIKEIIAIYDFIYIIEFQSIQCFVDQ